jgi:hypothetical protein
VDTIELHVFNIRDAEAASEACGMTVLLFLMFETQVRSSVLISTNYRGQCYICIDLVGVRGRVVGRDIVLQVGRSRIQFPSSSLEFSFTSSFQPHYGPGAGRRGLNLRLKTSPPSASCLHQRWPTGGPWDGSGPLLDLPAMAQVYFQKS